MKNREMFLAEETPVKILIVYYSFSRTTARLAEEIARQTGGNLRPLIPETSYAFDYNTAAKQARQEIERGFCPKLASGLEPVDGYGRLFIGSPNWFKTFAPPVLSFLRGVDLAGKTVIPFCTHGGGGFGHMEADIEKECPRSKMLSGYAAMSSFAEGEVTAWLEGIGAVG
jgi:flavodoxin